MNKLTLSGKIFWECFRHPFSVSYVHEDGTVTREPLPDPNVRGIRVNRNVPIPPPLKERPTGGGTIPPPTERKDV